MLFVFSGSVPHERRQFILQLNLNKLTFNEETENGTVELIKAKIDGSNVTMFYELAKIFHLPKSNNSLKYVLFIFGKLSQEENIFISELKLNNSLTDEDRNIKIYKHFTEKITIYSAAFYYQFASKLNYPELAAQSLSYIERCFTMVVNSKSFLELDYETLEKILDSSDLYVSSEFEVLNAAGNWLNHNIDERSKFARKLLMKVRLPLLSEAALKFILNKHTSFSKNSECDAILKQVLSRN